MKRTLIGLMAFMALAAPAHADQPPADAPAATDAGKADSRTKAAADLVGVLDLERIVMGGATAMIDAMIEQNPNLGPYRSTILKWAERFMTWETMGPQVVALYADTFTEPELRDMIAFYKTPTGKKVLAVTPDLTRRSAAMGADIAKAHMAELQDMVRERAAELEKDGSKP